MTFDLIRFTQDALWLLLLLSAPPILAATIVGLLISFLQAITQIQDQTLAFSVKLLVIIITLFVTGGLIGESLFQFAERVFATLPTISSSQS